MKIYLAGPLFTLAERAFNVTLRDELSRLGYHVWLPQEKCSELDESDEIFESCVDGIDWCDVVVANMDGSDPDSGTCWECGYAYRKKAIVLFRTDFRRCGDDDGGQQFNLMLAQSADGCIAVTSPSTVEYLAKQIHLEITGGR